MSHRSVSSILSRGRRLLVAASLGALVAGSAVAAGSDADIGPASRPAPLASAAQELTDATGPAISRTEVHARASRCGARIRGSYPWPLEPFDAPHPVRGDFGDPRTILMSSASATAGAFSFHNGVDISAPPGAPVFPVVSGVADGVSPDEITVDAGGRTFLYYHLDPKVRRGERVWARQTVLGVVHYPFGHVHLSELDGDLVRNPLAPGHLTPYRDSTVPVVHGIGFRGLSGRGLDPEALSGTVDLVAWADDRPALEPLGAWRDVPTAPALVSWELRRPSGRVVIPEQVAVDFLRTEPPKFDFWDVYIPGTYQNFPVVGDRYEWGLGGRYLFDLTADPLDTSRLAPGPYLVTVKAADTCGNVGALTERIRIRRQTPSARTVDARRAAHAFAGMPRWPAAFPVATWPHRRRGWTVALAVLPEGIGLDAPLGRLRDAHAAGLDKVGVIRTDAVENLPAGFVVVYSGSYGTERQAEAAARSAAVMEGFPGAHSLLIVRRSRGVVPQLPRRM